MAKVKFVKKYLQPKKIEGEETPKVVKPKIDTTYKPISLSDTFNKVISKYIDLWSSNLIKHDIDIVNFGNACFAEVKSNKKLEVCLFENPDSLMSAFTFASFVGLSPSEIAGELFLITDNVVQNGKSKVFAKPQIGYKGYVTMIHRNKDIVKVWSEVVFENDKFNYVLGLEPKLVHEPDLSSERKASTIKYVYAVAKFKNGEHQFVVLSRSDIESLRDLSNTVNSLYFNDTKDPNHWMIKKAAIKQLAKMLPRDYDSKKALDIDNSIEGGGTLIMDLESNDFNIINKDKPRKKSSGIYSTWSV
jgi:phage RecT family recombinase